MADFTDAERRKLASQGVAMGDGRYPIRNQSELDNAVKDWIRTGRQGAVKAWIVKRARALDLTVPDDVSPSTAPDELQIAKSMTNGKG